MPITFQVTNTPANEVSNLPAFSLKQILPKKQTSNYELIASSLPKVDPRDQGSDTDLLFVGSNAFVLSALKCYSLHHHLVIRPDDVWISICTQFSNYVNAHAEELREMFVAFEGKKELIVYGSGNLYSADYESLCQDMTMQISKNIKDSSIRDWIMNDFSTTTALDRMVSAVMLMSTTKSYFDYKFHLLCNLPSVTLLGEVEDWVKVRERANKLLEFNVDGCIMGWSQKLFPVLDKLVETSKGNIDCDWWNRIVNRHGGGSGPRYISGWITVFNVFSENGKWLGNEESDEWYVIDDNDVARGYVNVPVTINDNGTEHKTELFAGHFCCQKGKDNKTIQPRVDWALFELK
ncbi:hypothetical protein C9374_012495 [Naegleria lovaniensis]|uniref:DUF4419 domain-containing protein n=1 Tax=Naegleria lovaniensis TaxID=51637 RepID=A0AA88KNL5_NAELO|nr:uncharacterized protein C9374_012495 [Naegleria lovaniensis]KAG2392243.1 hypothetical protein C9374_012495 [Naegleria lovaniensis]